MLVGAPDPEEMARNIVERGLNVRQVEALAKERTQSSAGPSAERAPKQADIVALERRVSDALGLAVTVNHQAKGGVLQIRYRTLDQLDEVLRRLEKS
jgi:ParB family chromosome partitioning protein